MTHGQPTEGAIVVQVTRGPFTGFNGVVRAVDQARGTIHITVSMFGKKDTTFEIDVHDVRRVAPHELP